jgi:hypothetical protein
MDSLHRSGTTQSAPLRVCFDDSAGATLRLVLTEQPGLFSETGAAEADLVIFGSDEIAYVKNSALYRANRGKSFCITESDIPTFRLPGLYAANQKGFLTARRTRTMNYFISERERPNPEVKALIGEPREKRYLYSFMGGTNSWTRRRLFRAVKSQADTLVEPTDSYNHWASGADVVDRAGQMRRNYAEVMAASKFSLCPRGCGLSSYRLFESMSLGVAPVIISENWRPVADVDWSFAIFIREKQIPALDRIVRAHESEWQSRGAAAQAAYAKHFQPDRVAVTLHRQLSEVLASYNPQSETAIGIATELRAAGREAYWFLYYLAKRVVLKAVDVTGASLPFRVRQPMQPGDVKK